METVLVGSILGAGYLLSQNGKNPRTTIQSESAFHQPSQNSIYDSTFYPQTQSMEAQLVNDSFDKARNAIETNVIPPQFNNGIFNTQTNPISYLQKPVIDKKSTPENNGVLLSPLTGLPMSKTEFTHANMMPYFGSHVRQVTIEDSNASILENHTGASNYQTKKEAVPLFEPTRDVHIQYGTQNKNDDIQTRFNPSVYRQNELPFDQVRVGPGINNGYSATPTGGFHQDVREYVLPKTIDELRPLSRPQITYKGRVVPGKSINGKREQIGKMETYKPDTFFENTPDRYLTTTGAYLKGTARPEQIVRETNRKESKHYTGVAGPAIRKKITTRSLYKNSIKTNFKTDGPRNAYQNNGWGNETFGDYGKQAITPISNERDVTSTRTHVSNVTSAVKAIIAPLLDVMRPTIKETTIDEKYTGQMQATNQQGNVILDKEAHKFRTTLRETTDPQETILNMKANPLNVVQDKEAHKFRTTIKETLIDDNHLGIVKGPVRLTVYDPDDVTRTTMKETMIYNERNGNIGGVGKHLGYLTNEMEAPNTMRQFTSDYEYEGIVNSEHAGLGYLTNEMEAPNTTRQFTSDYEYEGGANSLHKRPTTYDAEYNMRQNIVREGTLKGRNPTPSNTAMFVGKDTVNVEVKKIEGDLINTRQPASQKVYNSIKEIKPLSVTQDRNQYDHKLIQDRIEPEILNAFRNNPYTQSLSAYAYS